MAPELNCLSDAKDDVIAEYAAAGLELVDEFEDVLLERAWRLRAIQSPHRLPFALQRPRHPRS